jgi:hypothetical protein
MAKASRTSFLDGAIWPSLTRLARKQIGHVAVAYLGKGAQRLLPLKANSTLVVDASDAAVRSGLTDPVELMRYVRKGVRVHSAAALHAKVFVFGSTTVVGSTNASTSSATRLIEGAVRLDDRHVATAARAFIDNLLGEKLELPMLRRLATIFRPARFLGAKAATDPRRKGRASGRRTPIGRRLWAVVTCFDDWDALTHENADAERPRALSKVDRRKEELDELYWKGGLVNRLANGDQVVQVHGAGGKVRLFAPAHVVRIRRFRRSGRKTWEMVVFLAQRKGARAIDKRRAHGLLGREGAWLKHLTNCRLIRDPSQAHALRQLWKQA